MWSTTVLQLPSRLFLRFSFLGHFLTVSFHIDIFRLGKKTLKTCFVAIHSFFVQQQKKWNSFFAEKWDFRFKDEKVLTLEIKIRRPEEFSSSFVSMKFQVAKITNGSRSSGRKMQLEISNFTPMLIITKTFFREKLLTPKTKILRKLELEELWRLPRWAQIYLKRGWFMKKITYVAFWSP